MPQLRTAAAGIRATWALAFAILLALRLLTPAGFMPAFDHGAVTIVVCPDADPPPPPMHMAGHHHQHPKKLHQSCPYASASALGGLTGEMPFLAALLAVGLALLLGRTFAFLERHRGHDWPPAIGPPIPA